MILVTSVQRPEFLKKSSNTTSGTDCLFFFFFAVCFVQTEGLKTGPHNCLESFVGIGLSSLKFYRLKGLIGKFFFLTHFTFTLKFY